MPETIYKLEPHRTMHLRGVDRFGAAGSFWGAGATGWKMSGVFRDMADFAVLMFWDVDDYFGHYLSSKYLPDFDFSGMVLTFDITATGVQQLDSPANQWVPWRSLSYVLENGEGGAVDLKALSTYVSGTRTAASATITVNTAGVALGDRVTIWYQNIAFDYWPSAGGDTAYAVANFLAAAINAYNWVAAGLSYPLSATTTGTSAGNPSCSQGYFNYYGTGFVHTLTIGANTYSYTQLSTDGSSDVATKVALAAASDPNCSCVAVANNVDVSLRSGITGPITVSSSDGGAPATLTSIPAVAGIIVSCTLPIEDGNAVTLYTQAANGNTTLSPSVASLTGGVSAATWQVSIDFSGLGINSLRQAWMTFAPQIQNGAPWPTSDYVSTEWAVTVTNWAVTDPNSKRPLKIAGPGSVRVDSRSGWTSYAGSSWIEEASNQPGGTGWFNAGFANRMNTPGDSVSIKYSCQSVHNLYLGTSLYTDRGIVSVSIDGGTPMDVDCYYNEATEPVVTRRFLAAVAAGNHTVVIVLLSGNHTALGSWDANSAGTFFYFDYLDAAVLSDVPDRVGTYGAVMPATDFDTDHGYRLSPERLIWMLTKLGFAGQLDHYLGVFWWNQRQRVGGVFPSASVTFGGTWASGDSVFLTVSGETIGKSVFPADSVFSIAAHFAYFINSTFTGVRATASGATLIITNRTPEFSFTLTHSASFAVRSPIGTPDGTITVTGSLSGGTEGAWVIDDAVTPVINRAATDWHTDFWAQVAGAGLTGVASFSMELVNPPDATGHVYAQRFADGTEVLTDTGFGGLNSTQCTFNAVFRAYQQEAFLEMAGMMAAAGLVPYLQFGEFLWWYFALAQAVPIGYASYTSPISIGTTVPHGLSTGQKVLQAGVLGNTAANGTFTITKIDSTHYTLNGTSGNGAYTGGGTVTGGGMAYYDADTAAAAVTALGRALATFSFPTDDPSVNAYADANFLRGLIYSHAAAIAAFVQAIYATARFEVLWPYDVNYPTPTALAGLGGAMNRYVNLPSQWETLTGSGLARMKMEALAFGATERSLTLALQAISFPLVSPLSWPLADTAYLVPIFNGGCPWTLEFLATHRAIVPSINLWAFDHFCLLSWPLPLPSFN